MRPIDHSRRRVLAGLAAVPLAAMAAVAAARLGVQAALVRPGARGSSSRRCGSCGATDHTMLEPTCPLAPEVL